MIRMSVTAAALALAAAATPSFAGGYKHHALYPYAVPSWSDDGSASRLVVDSRSGRVVFDDVRDEDCIPRRNAVIEEDYIDRTVHPGWDYGY